MNSLMNYGSDDECEGSSSDEKDCRATTKSTRRADTNYDEVGMDLSEDSNDSKKGREKSYTPPREKEESRGHKKREESSRRHDKKYKSRSRSRDRDRDREGSSRSRDDAKERRYKDERREKYRDKERRRSRSRERKSKSPRRERSRSRERDRYRNSKRYDRASNKMDRLDKMGIEIKTPDCQYVKPSELQKSMDQEKDNGKDRFFMPGITGRFRDQIERRKMLWQKKSEPDVPVQPAQTQPLGGAGGSRSTRVWETTTFAQDTDGKVASKFKRLMGIKGSGEGSGKGSDILKKQEEMFSSMEQQYEVARTATHTMRGVGLGFGSFQR